VTGTDTSLRLPRQPEPFANPLPDALAALEAEFVVEWQVAPGSVARPEK
jgi:hypothetical protein